MFPRIRTASTPFLARASSSTPAPSNIHILQSKPQQKSLRQISAQGGVTTRAVDLAIARTEGWYSEMAAPEVAEGAEEGGASRAPKQGEKKKGPMGGKGLGSSLLSRRREAGGLVDADAVAIVGAQAPPPRNVNQQRPRTDRVQSARPPTPAGAPTTSYSSKYIASAGGPPRPPRSPASASSSGKPTSKPKSGPPRFPSGPRRDSRNNSRPERVAAVPLERPTRFTPNAPIDLAALISQDLQTRFHRSPVGTLPLAAAGSDAGELAATGARLEAMKERMGDYSRFWPDGKEGGKEAVGVARRMLALNASVGLKEREALLAVLEKALPR
jgi:hypothetical protein